MYSLISKLKLLGNEVQVLTKNSILVKNSKKELIGYRLYDNKIEVVDYIIGQIIPGSDKYIQASKGSNTYILDLEFEKKLKFSNEIPALIIDDSFVVLNNISTRTKRVIDISGNTVTITLAWGVEIYKGINNQLVIIAEHNSGLDVSIAIGDKTNINNIKWTQILALDRTNSVYVADKYIAVKYKNKKKIILFDYNGNITLSIPEGRMTVKNNNVNILDKVGKCIKSMPEAKHIYT